MLGDTSDFLTKIQKKKSMNSTGGIYLKVEASPDHFYKFKDYERKFSLCCIENELYYWYNFDSKHLVSYDETHTITEDGFLQESDDKFKILETMTKEEFYQLIDSCNMLGELYK